MDYSELVTALQENNSSKANELIEALMPRLISFLRIHMNANLADAKDCAQEALLTSIKRIREDKLRNPEHVVTYLLSSCRNTYLKMVEKNRNLGYGEIRQEQSYAAPQLQSLMDEEQERILKWCLDQLKKKYREFMTYWFDHPEVKADKVADHFDISVNNVWTRKHRLIKKLNECYMKKYKF